MNKMKVGEIIKELVNAKSYALKRSQLSDGFITLMKDYFPLEYEIIKEKEEAYQELIKFLNINNDGK